MKIDQADMDSQNIADMVQKFGDDSAWKADGRTFVEFRKEWSGRPNQEKSEKEGRPVFDEVEFIRITVPGDRNNIVDCPVNELHRLRFKVPYEAWRAQNDDNAKQTMTGTPIEKWSELTRGDAESLRYLHIYTVEQLCTLDDNVLTKHPGLREMQRRARQWIDVATKNAAASQLRAEKDKAEAEKNQVKSQLEDANRRLAQLEERLLKGK